MRRLPNLLVLYAAACAGPPPDEPAALGCEGAETTWVRVGEETEVGFLPWEDGDAVTPAGEDELHLRLDFQVAGLDAREPVTVVVRLALGDDPTTDLLARADLSCADPGPAEYGALATLPEAWQLPPDALAGTPVRLDAVFTDAADRVADLGVDLVIAP